MNSSSWETAPMGYSTVETLLEEVSNHMAASNISRHSRGSTSAKSGVSMRVAKPNSANNSPRNSIGLGRRMTDGAYRKRLAQLEQGSRQSGSFVSHDGLHAPNPQSTRPVSWHPASQIPQTTYQPTYPQQYSNANTNFQFYDVQAQPVAYSGYNSPASGFSPASGPSNGYEQQQYMSQARPHTYNPYSTYDMNQQHQITQAMQQPQQYAPAVGNNVDPSMYSHFDWSNFATNGFEDSSTTPPTPENFLPIQHPEPTFPAEDAIPYHALDDSDEGEELIGLGLYDAPEVKSALCDPYLDNYRAQLMSQHLGTPFRRPEPAGKGLKLEEGWNPPGSEDGEDSDEDGDAEDDEVEEVPVTRISDTVRHNDVAPSHTNVGMYVPASTHQVYVQNYGRDGWV